MTNHRFICLTLNLFILSAKVFSVLVRFLIHKCCTEIRMPETNDFLAMYRVKLSFASKKYLKENEKQKPLL